MLIYGWISEFLLGHILFFLLPSRDVAHPASLDRCSLPSSFYIHFFLGDVPAASETWAFAPTLIASHVVLAPLGFNPANQTLSYGQIPLTSALLASSSVSDLKPDSVIPILKDQLHWRAQAFDNRPIDAAGLTSLKLYVAGQEVSQWDGRHSDKLPVYGRLIAYREITRGKAGGLRDEDPL